MYITIQLEQTLTKNQIIEAYLNKIYLGASSNGIEAAAKTYFNKEAKDLDLGYEMPYLERVKIVIGVHF